MRRTLERAIVTRKRVVGVLLVVLLAGGGMLMRRWLQLGQIGVGYAAHQVCSCVHLSHRPLASCQGELDPLARKLVTLELSGDEVSAKSLLGHSRARFEDGWGCTVVE
jgi:hypothetical protein